MKRVLFALCIGAIVGAGSTAPSLAGARVDDVDIWFDVSATSVSPLGTVQVSGNYACRTESGSTKANIDVDLNQSIDMSNSVSGQVTLQDVTCGEDTLQHWQATVRPAELQGSIALRLFQVGKPIKAVVKISPDGEPGLNAADEATLLKDQVGVVITSYKLVDPSTIEISGEYSCAVEGGASIVQTAFLRQIRTDGSVLQGAATVILPCTAWFVPWSVRVQPGQCGDVPPLPPPSTQPSTAPTAGTVRMTEGAAAWAPDADVVVDLTGDLDKPTPTEQSASRDHVGSHRNWRIH